MIKEEDHNVQFSDVITAEELGDREAPTANVRVFFPLAFLHFVKSKY